MAESASGHPMGFDNYKNGGVKVPGKFVHSNEVLENGFSVSAVTGPGDFF